MASAALGVRSQLKAAELGADATRFAGQQLGNSALLGGIVKGLSGLASGAIGGFLKANPAGGAKPPTGIQGDYWKPSTGTDWQSPSWGTSSGASWAPADWAKSPEGYRTLSGLSFTGSGW
jgi:hypothetical protein